MRLEKLLEELLARRSRILQKLNEEEKRELKEILYRVSSAKGSFKKAKKAIFDYCWKNSYLSEAIDETGEPKITVFRGQPDPKPLSKDTEKIRLLANRLIDAIDESKD